MAKAKEVPAVEETAVPLNIGTPSNAVDPIIPPAAHAKWLEAVLPFVINAVQAAFSGNSQAHKNEKGVVVVEGPDGAEKLSMVKSIVCSLVAHPGTKVETIDSDFVGVRIEARLAEMKNNATLAR